MGRGEGEPDYSIKPGSTMGRLALIMVKLLQWNARSIKANGQEFKHFIKEMDVKPDVVCVQETWLKPTLESWIISNKERQRSWGREKLGYIHQTRYPI